MLQTRKSIIRGNVAMAQHDGDDAEQQELSALESVIMAAQAGKVELLRKRAHKNVIAAMNLEDLKSKSGNAFIENDHNKTWRDYRTATTHEAEREVAYLCCSMYFDDSKSGCGWVKGDPREANYDEIGPMCGSKGYRQFCRICGTKIGETQLVIS